MTKKVNPLPRGISPRGIEGAQRSYEETLWQLYLGTIRRGRGLIPSTPSQRARQRQEARRLITKHPNIG